MNGYNDITCEHCRGRIGWYGEFTEAPDCPHCGVSPDTSGLLRTENEIARMRKKVLAMDEKEDTQ